MEECKWSETVPLEKTLPVLAKSTEVFNLLAREFGKEKATLMLDMMASGKLSGTLGAEVNDYFEDAIQNESESVWSGVTRGSEGSGVDILHFHGVYYVHCYDWFGPIGYFLNEQKAMDCVHFNWELAEEEEEEKEDD